MDKGMFVTLEGIDACGKTYLAERLLTALQNRNQKSCLVSRKESNGGDFSSFLKEAVKTYLMLAERMERRTPSSPLLDLISASGFCVLYYENVYPLITNGVTAVSDSWCYKGMARQIVNARLYGEPESLKPVYEQWIVQVHQPALTIDYSFLLDTPVEVCWERKKNYSVHETGKSIGMTGSDKETFFEYQSMLRGVFLEFSHQMNWHILRGDTREMIDTILEVLYGKS